MLTGFLWEIQKERDQQENPDAGGRIISYSDERFAV
jgi:hypothetical protein